MRRVKNNFKQNDCKIPRKNKGIIMKALLESLEEKFTSIQSLKTLALNYDEALLTYLAKHPKARAKFFLPPPPLSLRSENLAILNKI